MSSSSPSPPPRRREVTHAESPQFSFAAALAVGAGSEAPLYSKSVTLGTPRRPVTVTTALYEVEDDVAALK